jgi:hypothetical protein
LWPEEEDVKFEGAYRRQKVLLIVVDGVLHQREYLMNIYVINFQGKNIVKQ